MEYEQCVHLPHCCGGVQVLLMFIIGSCVCSLAALGQYLLFFCFPPTCYEFLQLSLSGLHYQQIRFEASETCLLLGQLFLRFSLANLFC